MRGIFRAGCFALCGAPPVTVMAPNEATWRRRFMLVVSPTRYVPASAYAHAGPIAPAPAPFRASSLRWTCAASKTLRLRHPRLHALHYAQGVRAYGAHSTCPHAPQKSRQAALFDYAQSAACHAFCGDGACPVELATLGGQPLRGFRGSSGGQFVSAGVLAGRTATPHLCG